MVHEEVSRLDADPGIPERGDHRDLEVGDPVLAAPLVEVGDAHWPPAVHTLDNEATGHERQQPICERLLLGDSRREQRMEG